jgi:flagellar protein FliO/FliZ
MQFMTALFGGTESTLLNAAFALGIVIVLIVLGLWGLKVLTNATGRLSNTRKRLVVVDKAQVDGKRQVVIIRRDNVEHVIMTGGPQDLIIESGVAAPQPAQPLSTRRPQRPAPVAPARPDQPAPAAATEHKVPREAVDRLRDLARPAPLKPRQPTPTETLRNSGLIRREVIPMSPELRVDNSAATQDDSAKPASDGTDGQLRLGSKGRFFRGVIRGDRS